MSKRGFLLNITFALLMMSIVIVSYGQNSNLDSLLALTKTVAPSESCKLHLLIAEEYLEADVNQSVHYSRKAYQNCSNKVDKLRALSSMVEAFKQMRKFDSVDAYVDEALQLSYDLEDKKSISMYLSERGWKYFYLGDYKKATVDFKQSFKLFTNIVESEKNTKNIDSTRFESMTNNLGVAYTKMGQFDSAIYYFYLSMEYKKKYHASPKKITNSLINLSALNIHKNDYPDGKLYAQQGLEIAEQNRDSVGLAQCLINLGVCEKNIGDTTQALLYYHRALEIGRKINRNKTISSSLTNLGLIYLQNEEWNKAGKYLKESLSFNELSNNKSSYCNILSNVANYYYEIKKYDSAVYYAQKSLGLSREIGDIQIIENNYRLLAVSYEELNSFKDAYSYSVLLKQVHDSMFNKESTERFDELKIKYETAENDKEIIALKLENEVQESNQKRLWWSMGFISLVFAFLLYLFYLKRKKDKEIHRQHSLVLVKDKELSQAELEKSKMQEMELKNEIQYKSKQLTTHALNMMQKNAFLQEIQDELMVLNKKASSENKGAFNRLKILIKKNLRSEKDWDLFRLYFEDVNKQFYIELFKINPDLTSNDLKLCALLKLNMNIKESASVMNIEPASVKTARYKLRKKLGLKPEEDLVEVIRQIG